MRWGLLRRTPVQDNALPGGALGALSSPQGRRHTYRRRVVALLLLVCLLALAAYATVNAANAYLQYRHVRAEAADGLHHVQRVQALLAHYMEHPAIPDAATLHLAATELGSAERDFARTRRELRTGIFPLASRLLTSASVEVAAASSLAAAADEPALPGSLRYEPRTFCCR